MNGVHKLPYSCRIWTDGCGSMAHVKDAAIRLGIDHAYTPPREPSLNEAEKVCNTMWAAARAHLATTGAPSHLFALAVEYSMYMDLRTATTASRKWKTPFELIKGFQPGIAKLHRFYTQAFVNVPLSKRKALEKQGDLDRAEMGRLTGYLSPFSSTYQVMLSRNRLVHSSNVTFNDADCGNAQPDPTADASAHMGPRMKIEYHDCQASPPEGEGGAPSEAEAITERCRLFEDVHDTPLAPTACEYFEWTPGGTASKEWLTHAASPKPRPRPRYEFLCAVEDLSLSDSPNADGVAKLVTQFVGSVRDQSIDHEAVNLACLYLAMVAHKDMSWEAVLASDDRELAVRALKAEKDSLLSTILVHIDAEHPEYQAAVKEAISGRYLLDLKRVGVWKARGVKQGFKENKVSADGPGFVYYAHVAKLASVRMLLSRPNRGNRRIAVKDVRTAFLQSDKFPDHIVKYIKFRDPVTKVVEYYRQTGPIYGEAGAPVRWENTIAPWLEAEGYVRGCNEPAVYYHPTRDVLLLTYVDDLMYDGEEDDVQWSDDRLEARFDCKDTDWLSPDMEPMDYLGMTLHLGMNRIYLSMKVYIENCIVLLQLEELVKTRAPRTPINAPIDTSSDPLPDHLRSTFMTAVGCLGWLVETGRPDVALAHSRTSQHMSKPNMSAWETIRRIFHYLHGARHWCLSCPTEDQDVDLSYTGVGGNDSKNHWEFYVDSDFAGNSEVQNKRRSQIGIIALQNGFPVFWSSKVSSVAFADEGIGESHADTSSGAAEVYAAGNSTYDFLFLSHVASEMNLEFQRPFKIQMDNAAAECFAKGTAFKSKLKHIDCRQEWVRMLRDRNICVPVHVDSKDNLADMFTKILPADDFERLRSMIMYDMYSE